MSTPDLDKEKARQEQELRIQRQIAFASGLFQGDVTVRTLLESLAEGIVIIDNSGTVLLVNARAEQMFGYPTKELIGKPHSILIPERFRKAHEEHEAHFFAEPRIRPMGQLLDLAGRRRDGSEFPVEISLSFIETINGVLVLAFVSDMTFRKQYESRLQDSEELFRIQVECVKDYAIFMLDAQGNVLNWNVGAERLKGYGEKEIIGRHFSCFYPEEERDAGKPAEELKKAADEGRVEGEGWLIRKDGSRFWADVIITALRDENGNLRGFSKVTRDISGRKMVEDALRFSEARYRALFRDNPTMIVTLDTEWTMLSVNPSCASQLGYTIDELEGQSVLKLFHEDDRPAVAEQLHACLRNPDQVHRWQFRKIRKDGEVLWVEEIAQAVHDLNGTLNVLVVCQDVTERKRVEEALIRSEQKFSLAFQATPTVLVIASLEDGRYMEVNEAFERVMGYRRDEVIGRSSLELHIWQKPEDRAMVLRMLAAGKKVRELEIGFRSKPGTFIVGLYSAEIIEIGTQRCLLSLVNDITARKRAEEEVEILNTNLAARAFELETANRELEAFSYSVSHDLRKPLTVINGYCQIIQESCGNNLNAQCQGYLQEINDGTLSMNQLIDALLNFSRLAHIEPRRETIDLSAMAHEVAEELKLVEPGRRVTFLITDGVSADGDAGLLRVVLDNLLGNAWKYTGTRDEGIIEFGTTKVDGKPACFVRDNGAGFDMADADKLFAPFQRLPGTDEFRGHGIGLATVERIIQRHGGRVWAKGEPGKGATFYFTLST
ncbi:PAS domain S-box protein [Geotalea uraniireducens]|uniref:histidine kinase n=1 Tax=Geotalea uraniireducens (strain Rf4) TaxID=351605 RepID=A5G6W6_GEOUR|nr:PAS domain S-box protein [Geotalea uraniireducens]ABQ27534.1 PAS/PAC sensor signal transduction histidine kinase [Geotalea uraniireducens Rf4]